MYYIYCTAFISCHTVCHSISNFMLPLIWQEVLVHVPEVRGPWVTETVFHPHWLCLFMCYFCSAVLCFVGQSCPVLCEPMDCIAHQAPQKSPWGFSKQEYWSGLPCPPPGIFPSIPLQSLPNPGIKPRSPALQAGFLPSEPPGKPKDTVYSVCIPWADKWSLSHVGSSEVFHWAVCVEFLPGCGPAFTRPPVRAKLPTDQLL